MEPDIPPDRARVSDTCDDSDTAARDSRACHGHTGVPHMGRLTHHNTPGPVRAATSQRHGSCIIASVVADGTGGGACRPANGSIAATRPLSGRDHGAHMLSPPRASFCALSQQEARLEPSPPTTPALRRGGDAIVVVVPIPLRGGPGRGGGARAILVHGDHRVRRAPRRRASPSTRSSTPPTTGGRG